MDRASAHAGFAGDARRGGHRGATDRQGVLIGIEVKTAKRVGTEDLRGLRAWQSAFAHKGEIPRAILLHQGEEPRFLGDNAWALGLGALLPA